MYFSKSGISKAPDLLAELKARLGGEDEDSPVKRRRFSSDNDFDSFPYVEEVKSVFSDGDILI